MSLKFIIKHIKIKIHCKITISEHINFKFKLDNDYWDIRLLEINNFSENIKI